MGQIQSPLNSTGLNFKIFAAKTIHEWSGAEAIASTCFNLREYKLREVDASGAKWSGVEVFASKQLSKVDASGAK